MSGRVSGLRAAAGNASLDLSWAAQVGASSYKIQWRSTAEDWDAGSRQATSPTASKKLDGLTNGTDYVVRVAAVFAAGDAAWSDEAAGRPVAQPSLLRVSNVTATGATLTLGGHTGNWYLKGVGGTGSGAGYTLPCTGAGMGLSHTLSGLSGNTSYVFAAHSDSACSDANRLGTAYFTTPGGLSAGGPHGDEGLGGHRTARATTAVRTGPTGSRWSASNPGARATRSAAAAARPSARCWRTPPTPRRRSGG